MRISEAVKMYRLETKQRILNNVLEAAERDRENSAALYADNNGRYIDKEKKNTITMSKGAQINEVRSRKGGMIAAACAALVICSGLAVLTNGSSIQTDKPFPAAVSKAAETPVGDAAEQPYGGETAEFTTEDDEDIAEEEPTDSAETLLAYGVTIDPNAVSDSEADLPQTFPNVTESENGTPASFAEYLAAADEIVTGMVDNAVPVTVTLSDGTTKNCIKYTIGSFIGTCNYNCAQNTLRFEDMREETLLQVVPEGTEPQLKNGEYGLFIAQKTRLPDYGDVYVVVGDGTFIYNDQKFTNAYRSDGQLNRDLNGYVSNNILYLRNSSLVNVWFNALGESVGENYDSEDETIPSYAVTGISYNAELNEQEITVNLTPARKRMVEIIFNNNEGSAAIEKILSEEKVSGFEDIDFYFNAYYYPANTAVEIEVVAVPREGSGFRFDDTKLSKLIVDNNSVEDIDSGVNADAMLKTDGIYYDENGELHFSLVFDQAGTDGAMDFDPNRTYTLKIDGIQFDNSGEVINGKYEFEFKFDTEELSSVPNVRIIGEDAPAVNGGAAATEE